MTPGNAAAPVSFAVNGATVEARLDPATPLLYFLRNDLALNGPKFGCGLGECGACAVLIDGRYAHACVERVGGMAGHDITTLEGLSSHGGPGAVQRAFIAEQAAQCGYCLNGMIIAAQALLSVEPAPDERTITEALRHQLCRCGAHVEIMRAVRRAARDLRA